MLVGPTMNIQERVHHVVQMVCCDGDYWLREWARGQVCFSFDEVQINAVTPLQNSPGMNYSCVSVAPAAWSSIAFTRARYSARVQRRNGFPRQRQTNRSHLVWGRTSR